MQTAESNMPLAQNSPEMQSRLFRRITPKAAFRIYMNHEANGTPFRVIKVNVRSQGWHVLGRFLDGEVLLLSIPHSRISGPSKGCFICLPRLFTLQFIIDGNELRFQWQEIEFINSPEEIPDIQQGYSIRDQELEEELFGDQLDGSCVDPDGDEVRCACLTQKVDTPKPGVPYNVTLIDTLGEHYAIAWLENVCFLLAIPDDLFVEHHEAPRDTIGTYVEIRRRYGYVYPFMYTTPKSGA